MKNFKRTLLASLVIVSASLFASTLAGCSKSEGEYNFELPPIAEFTYDDAIAAYDAFNQHLFSKARGVYKRDTESSNEIAVGWTQAMMFDMTMNAYKLTGDQKYLDLMTQHFQGCKQEFRGFDWWDIHEWNLYDDMMWWVGSFARAYLLTNDAEYLTLSETGFHRIWNGDPTNDALIIDGHRDKGSWDTGQYGGMRWDWKFGGVGKMACINYPTVIAAMELYKATANPDYLAKAKQVYAWSAANLFNATTGAVADSKHDGNQTPAWHMLIYNQATCMGSAAMLYLETNEQTYLNHAVAAMDYIVKNKSTANNILIPEGKVDQKEVADEMGIYNAILAQYIPILITECGQDQYLEYIQRSINYGWKNRDTKRNITNKFLEKVPSSADPLSSYTASGIPALMLTFPNVADR